MLCVWRKAFCSLYRKGSMAIKKRTLATKYANILGDFGKYYHQSKQYCYKSKILQASEERTRLKRCSYGQKTETKMDRKEIYAKVNYFNTQVIWWPIIVHSVMTNTKEGIIQSKHVEIVLDAYSSRVRCSFHCSFQKNFLQLHLLLSLVGKKTSHAP